MTGAAADLEKRTFAKTPIAQKYLSNTVEIRFFLRYSKFRYGFLIQSEKVHNCKSEQEGLFHGTDRGDYQI